MTDLTSIGYVKRIVVGSVDPEKRTSEEEAKAAMALLNRCLAETPKGRILGVERGAGLLSVGDQQAMLQSVTYHVGFSRRPHWLQD